MDLNSPFQWRKEGMRYTSVKYVKEKKTGLKDKETTEMPACYRLRGR
jgi:hypothetical protein